MDVSGSFLELTCARVALVPIGSSISESRFEELVCHLNACREVPLNALPRRAALPRPSGSATYSSMPEAFREAIQGNKSPVLTRSISAGRDFTRLVRRTGTPSPNLETPSDGRDTSDESIEDITDRSNTGLSDSYQAVPPSSTGQVTVIPDRKQPTEPGKTQGSSLLKSRPEREERSLKPSGSDLNLSSPEVDSSFRMRFEVVRRDSRGALLLKSPSEWDEFHSSGTWGVIGLCDSSEAGEKDEKFKSVYNEFRILLEHFKNAAIRRLMVLSSSDRARASPPAMFQETSTSSTDGFAQVPFTVGFIPANISFNETKLEIRAQVTHFAGLLIAAIDRDCWKRRESPQSELFLSPIDEKHSADRQSKLAKRRAGRLDKLLADSLLLMGSPREALVKYNSAIERAKASSDRLWLAGAMEGWSAAHVLSHVGSGGHVDDVELTDMLIEHYNEIYKLYQKKRAAEPEAGAALRLAEYLGTWTSRRNDAMKAAQHAASVGEGLKAQKRASLWEALARFSERMGCRRKAALFLYRLGSFNASQSSWSSAVELMLASEGQLTRQGYKPWASLNRQILLRAARYAEEANDSSTAARLLVEALVVSPAPKGSAETDDTVMAALQRAQVPSFLPGSSKIIRVQDIDPLHLQGSSFKMKSLPDVSGEVEPAIKSGPFIYNPFEAKKKAMAAAVARRTVNWVCGEPASVSLTLSNCLNTKVSIELISVLFAQEDEAETPESSDSAVAFLKDDLTVMSAKRHSALVREALETSSSLVKTISESIHVDPSVVVTKAVTVIPKRPGHILVRGLLVRLFGGALVVVASPSTSDAGRSIVNVMPELPILSVTHPSSGVASADTFYGRRAPVSVLEGETRKVKISIRNAGKDLISWISAKLDVSDPSCVSAHAEGLHSKDLLQALQFPGSAHTVVLTLSGGLQSFDKEQQQLASRSWTENRGSCIVTCTVQYEGSGALGIVRESHASMKISSEPVISVDQVRQIGSSWDSSPPDGRRCLMVVELSNEVSVPADVSLAQPRDGLSSMNSSNHSETDKGISVHRRCLLESEASVRLVQSVTQLHPSLKKVKAKQELSSLSADVASNHRVDWSLPAFGRKGRFHIRPSSGPNVTAQDTPLHERGLLGTGPKLYVLPRDRHGNEITAHSVESKSACCVRVGAFITVLVRLELDPLALRKLYLLDAAIESGITNSLHGQHYASLAGASRGVPVDLMKQNGTFLEHQFRARFLSAGVFYIRVSLRAKESSSKASPDDIGDLPKIRKSETSRKGGSPEPNIGHEQRLPASKVVLQQRRTAPTWAESTVEETNDCSDTELRRLNLSPSVNVILPTTVDMYHADAQHCFPDPLAISLLPLRVMTDAK